MTPLRRRMIEDMQIRNLALNTQDTYVQQVERFARHFCKSPKRLGAPEIIRHGNSTWPRTDIWQPAQSPSPSRLEVPLRRHFAPAMGRQGRDPGRPTVEAVV
jgi:hypothetical protein